MVKKIALVLLIALLAAGAAFAQDKEGYIKPTFGFGFSTMSLKMEASAMGFSESADIGKVSGLALFTGVDFVNSTGITIGLKYTMFPEIKFKPAGGGDSEKLDMDFISTGIGYTYNAEAFSIGGKLLLAMPINIEGISTGLDFGLGIDFTYWITETIGITALGDLYFIRKKETVTQNYGGFDIDVETKLKATAFIFGVGLSLKF